MRGSPRAAAGEGRDSGARCGPFGALSAFRLGHWAEADDWISVALERDPVGSHGVLAHGARALLDLGRGRLDSAAEHLEVVLLMCRAFTATAYGWTDLYSSIALLSIARRQPSEAIDSVRESLARSAEPDRDVHMRVCHRLAIRAAADLAEVARPLGDKAGLREALAIGREFGRRLDRHGQLVRALPGGGDPHLALDEALGKAESSRLVGRSSPAAWATAAAAAAGLHHPHDAAYARFREAEALLLARGSRAAAQAAAVDAHRVASNLGALPLLRDIEGLARRSRLDLAPPAASGRASAAAPAAPAGRAPFRLTRREQDVLERLTLGRSNREIAADLFISEKTASVHVSNIKSKLGANGRAEIAAIAVRLGLVSESADGDEMAGPMAGGWRWHSHGRKSRPPVPDHAHRGIEATRQLLEQERSNEGPHAHDVRPRRNTSTRPSWPGRAGTSSREVDALRMMAQGRPNAEIATEVFVSETTVKTHVAHVLAKLGEPTCLSFFPDRGSPYGSTCKCDAPPTKRSTIRPAPPCL